MYPQRNEVTKQLSDYEVEDEHYACIKLSETDVTHNGPAGRR